MTAIRPMFSSEAAGAGGNMVPVTATSTPGTTLHTAISGTNHIDEVYVYACNIHTADVQITFEIDGTAAANQMIETVPYKDGYHLVLPGIRLQDGGTVAMFAGTTAVINCIVIVNRYIDLETAS